MQRIKLESVRRKSGGRVHLTPRVPRSGPVTTLCNQTLGDGSYVAVFRGLATNNDYTITQDRKGAIAVRGEFELKGEAGAPPKRVSLPTWWNTDAVRRRSPSR